TAQPIDNRLIGLSITWILDEQIIFEYFIPHNGKEIQFVMPNSQITRNLDTIIHGRTPGRPIGLPIGRNLCSVNGITDIYPMRLVRSFGSYKPSSHIPKAMIFKSKFYTTF